MHPPRDWSRLKEIVDQALSLDPDSRNLYVEAACRGDPGLRAEVDGYLLEYAELDGFLGESHTARDKQQILHLKALYGDCLQSPSVHPSDFSNAERFQFLEKLGSGGLGEVYKAYDSHRRQTVAIKVPIVCGEGAVSRFKREFRSLADVSHRNIVTLYELFGDERRWYFTMEYLQGLNVRVYIRSASINQRIERVRSALLQIAEGLNVLHAAKILHRDIKPSNVWVTEEGRLVLLDFGLAQSMHDYGSSPKFGLSGTPNYCSPEQAAGLPLTTASDWYSVGVMLYEVLTGSLPFTGSCSEMMKLKQEQDGPAPMADGLPSDLIALCRDLLRRNPSARPRGDEVARHAGIPPHVISKTRTAAAPSLVVGRVAEQGILWRAWSEVREGRPAAVIVTGESGIGKTRLVAHALARMKQEGAIVFSARCYFAESVPYKALDELIELLARYLSELPTGELRALLPNDFELLTDVFPTLRLGAMPPKSDRDISDSVEKRRRAFEALWNLLARVSDGIRLVLAIDDLQWGDLDSMAFLSKFFAALNAPPILLLLVYRVEDAALSPVLLELAKALEGSARSEMFRFIQLGRLDARESEQLVRSLLPDQQARKTWGIVEDIVRTAAGDPFLIQEYTRHLTSSRPVASSELTSSNVLRHRLRELPSAARSLLDMVAIAAQPLDYATASRAWQSNADLLGARRLLTTESLLRVAGDTDALVAYHDRIREAAVNELDDSGRRFWHGRLARALEAAPNPDPERLADHFAGAGISDAAARYARAAADRAIAVFAFERAAHFYRMARLNAAEQAATQRELLCFEADALANAGRGPESASCFLSAAESAPYIDNVRLRANAVGQYLRSGHLRTALDLLPPLMREIGVSYPRSKRALLASLIWMRIRLLARGLSANRPHIFPAEQLMQIDVCWSVALGISMIDPLRSALFSARHTLFALELGDPSRLAMALAAEATQRALTDGGYGVSDSLLHKAFEAVDRSNSPRATAFVTAMRGVLACLRGRWEECYADCFRAAALFRECRTGPGWELTTSVMFTISMRFLLGEWPQVLEELPRLLRSRRTRRTLRIPQLPAAYVLLL